MPKKVHDCAKALMRKGKSEDSAWAICTASYNKSKGKGKSKSKSKGTK